MYTLQRTYIFEEVMWNINEKMKQKSATNVYASLFYMP